MKLIYIAGPYTSDTKYGIQENIMVAVNAAIYLRQNGIACFVPHLESMFHNDSITESEWMNQFIEILFRCDGILLLPGWQNSKGTNIEKQKAEEMCIPVFYDKLSVVKWSKNETGNE